jgi:hypothetical protein
VFGEFRSEVEPTFESMKTTPILSVVAALALPAGAASVSINMNVNNSTQNVTTPYGVITSSVWSNLRSGQSGTNFPDDSAAATTLDAVSTNPGGESFYGAPYAGTPMNSGPAVYSGTTTAPTLTLNQIPYDEYDIIVYLTGFTANTGASISDGTTTYYYQTPDPHDATLVQTLNTSGTGIPVANYAVFSNLTGTSQVLTIDHVDGGGAGLGGIQLVQIPEPGTAALLALGLLPLVRRRKSN